MGIELLEACRVEHVPKVVVAGTVCAYPRVVSLPFREADIWSGYPEETNAPYGLAKRMLLVQAQAYRQQYGCNFIYLLPTNLYGPGDHADLETSHVIPAMIRKFSTARDTGAATVRLWGDGSPTRSSSMWRTRRARSGSRWSVTTDPSRSTWAPESRSRSASSRSWCASSPASRARSSGSPRVPTGSRVGGSTRRARGVRIRGDGAVPRRSRADDRVDGGRLSERPLHVRTTRSGPRSSCSAGCRVRTAGSPPARSRDAARRRRVGHPAMRPTMRTTSSRSPRDHTRSPAPGVGAPSEKSYAFVAGPKRDTQSVARRTNSGSSPNTRNVASELRSS